MPLFDSFPNIVYPLTDEDGSVQSYSLTDLTARIKVSMSDADKEKMLTAYVLTSAETPEMVSDKVYGSPDYYWTIMMVNDIYDYASDWYKTDSSLTAYCKVKYGDLWNQPAYVIDDSWNVIYNRSPEIDKFYVMQNQWYRLNAPDLSIPYPGFTLSNPDDLNSTVIYNDPTDGPNKTITWYDYEYEINDRARIIKVVRREYLKDFLNRFSNELKKVVQ